MLLVKYTFGRLVQSNFNMPKNMGKSISVYHYIPLLDDRNVNDQGQFCWVLLLMVTCMVLAATQVLFQVNSQF